MSEENYIVMNRLFFYAFLLLGTALMNAQVSSTSFKNKLTATKKYNKESVILKEEHSNKKHTTLKRTVKIIRDKKKY